MLRRTLNALLGVDDTDQRTALAFALGVFVGFSPLLGLHTILGVALAFLFRLNRLAVLIGVFTNTPWFLVPYYGFAIWVGYVLLGSPDTISLPVIRLSNLIEPQFWSDIIAQWKLLMPAIVGSTVLSVILSLISYPFALFVIRKFRTRRNTADGEPGTA